MFPILNSQLFSFLFFRFYPVFSLFHPFIFFVFCICPAVLIILWFAKCGSRLSQAGQEPTEDRNRRIGTEEDGRDKIDGMEMEYREICVYIDRDRQR